MALNKNVQFSVRTPALRHVKAIRQMTYDHFPFEQAAEVELLGSEEKVQRMYAESIGRGLTVDGFHLVAVDKKGQVIGFAAVRQLHSGDGRASSSVCFLARLAVDPSFRSKGVGRRLLSRTVEAAGTLGYGATMATIPESLVSWYQKLQWQVGDAGHLFALIEQPHLGDDRLVPQQPIPAKLRGTYAPIQVQEPGPIEHGYTRIAHRATGSQSDLIHAWTAAGAPESAQALWETMWERPDLIEEMPKMSLLALMIETRPQGDTVEELRAMQLVGVRLSDSN